MLALLSLCGVFFLGRVLRAEVLGYNSVNAYFYWWAMSVCVVILLLSLYQLLAMQERTQTADDKKLALHDELVKALEKTLGIVEGEYPENQLVDPDLYNIQPIRGLLAEAKLFQSESSTQKDTIDFPDCVWESGRVTKVKTVDIEFQISTTRDYGNSRRVDTFDNIDDAVDCATTKRNKGDEYDDYHNKQNEVITKVTTIKEIVKVILANEKKITRKK